MKKLIPLAVILLGFFTSCQKNNVTPAKQKPDDLTARNLAALKNHGPDVYVLGDYMVAPGEYEPAYWKNGNLVVLSTQPTDEAFDIAVNGKDVYVSGVTTASGQTQAVYWKNDTVHYLNYGTAISFSSWGFAIAVNGSDVYVAGEYTDLNRNITNCILWKNGVAQDLAYNKYPSGARAVVVKNNKVYVGGYSSLDASGNTVATYWINGAHGRVRASTGNSSASSIAVNDRGDLYMAGYIADNGSPPVLTAAYWLDGVVQATLPGSNSSASGIALNNNDVYVVGIVAGGYSNFQSQAVYWKNTTQTLFGGIGDGYTGRDIAVTDDDIYLLAYEGGNVTYYKNGTPVQIPNANGFKIKLVWH